MSSVDIQAVSEVAKVLLVSPFEEDHLHLQAILRRSDLQPHSARTQREAFKFLRENVTPVMICECDLPDGTWQDILAQLECLDSPPLLVVTSRFADERLWSEVLNLGAYNVLAKPLSAKEVLHVLRFAALTWRQTSTSQRCLAQTA